MHSKGVLVNGVVNSDKFIRTYDDLYFGVTFRESGYIYGNSSSLATDTVPKSLEIT